MTGPLGRLRNSIKGTLDRRYVRHDHILALEQSLRRLEEGVDRTEPDFLSTRAEIDGIAQRLDQLDRGLKELEHTVDTFITDTRPHTVVSDVTLSTMRDDVADARRLASECAEAIEHLLQHEVLLRRDINALDSPR